MEVILLEKIRNLGDIGDKINVKSGFGRNFLLPQGKAVAATAENVAKFEKMRAELESKAAEVLAAAKARAESLQELEIVIPMQASEEGKLFGSVGVREIVEAVKAAGGDLNKKEVMLPEGSIHQTGKYDVNLQLHTDVVVPIKINIIAES